MEPLPEPPPKPLAEQLQGAVSASWQPLEVTGTHARLLMHVKRTALLTTPVTVRVELPPGATMRVGRTYIELPAGVAELNEPVEISYAQLPMHELVLTVTGTKDATTASTQARHRLGRPAQH
ncbi:MAG: hypothetical protein JNG84_11290 [Archangium sp.]|nr:hypothetical protein [Archangium sp.]